MTRFDQLLRLGLMDANLAQYEKVLQQAESAEPDFSPAYLRERMRLLADPWGWMRRRGAGRGRLNWRLVILIAVLLLLSACAYAVVTGQFSQWFPGLGIDSAAPETSEDVMSRMGTVIEESQTVNGETLTLNGVVWDGNMLLLSLTLENPALPEGIVPDAPMDYTQCRLELSEDQREEYLRTDMADWLSSLATPEEREEEVRAFLDMGEPQFLPNTRIDRLKEDGLLIEMTVPLPAYLEQPEFTLHMERVALAGEDGGESGALILNGPYDFNFTVERRIPPVSYTGEIQTDYEGIPLRITGIDITVLQMYVSYQTPAPDTPENMTDMTVMKGLQGLWTEDGSYVDCSVMPGSSGSTIRKDSQTLDGTAGRVYPHVIDPASVTAVDLGGTRIELRELTRQTE